MPEPNSNFTTSSFTAFAIEQVIKRDFKAQWTNATPLIACIKDSELNWNNGFTIQGLKLILPLQFADLTTPPAGVADANQHTADAPEYSAGATQAQYEFTHVRKGMWVSEAEAKIAMQNARGNFMQFKTSQMMGSFRNTLASQVEGTAADSRTSAMGTGYAISATNVVGGIDQNAQSWWQGTVSAVNGPLSLPLVNNMYDGLCRYADAQGRTMAPDLFLLGWSSTVNVYGRMREQIAPSERIVNAEFKAKYGFNNFMYLDMKCVQSQRLTSGTAQMLTSNTWYYGGYETPQALETIRLPGTDSKEYYYNMWYVQACDEIRRNGKYTGITG